MGLTANSTGFHVSDYEFTVHKQKETDTVIALAGNPNVGKSTLFNALTGLNQHTGNWPGKTVTNAQGNYHYKDMDYILVDLPGTYSLMPHSAEEVVARDFICFGDADLVVVVCDATCLERNLNLVFQTLEITTNVIVCVNLIDEAIKKGINIDLNSLEDALMIPVIGTSARNSKGLIELQEAIYTIKTFEKKPPAFYIKYTEPIEEAIAIVEPIVAQLLAQPAVNILDYNSEYILDTSSNLFNNPNPILCNYSDNIHDNTSCYKPNHNLSSRWIALKLIDDDKTLTTLLNEYLSFPFLEMNEMKLSLIKAKTILDHNYLTKDALRDDIVSCLVKTAEVACKNVVMFDENECNKRDRKLDKILTSKLTGIPIMLVLLCVIFWLTITGANYPSKLLSTILFWIQDRLTDFFVWLGTPAWVHGILILGIYRTLAWVISVMLPPMAIFFPLFTLLEDFGYLPRVAFNLDYRFKKCHACGKQALTMWLVDICYSL